MGGVQWVGSLFRHRRNSATHHHHNHHCPRHNGTLRKSDLPSRSFLPRPHNPCHQPVTSHAAHTHTRTQRGTLPQTASTTTTRVRTCLFLFSFLFYFLFFLFAGHEPCRRQCHPHMHADLSQSRIGISFPSPLSIFFGLFWVLLGIEYFILFCCLFSSPQYVRGSVDFQAHMQNFFFASLGLQRNRTGTRNAKKKKQRAGRILFPELASSTVVASS